MRVVLFGGPEDGAEVVVSSLAPPPPSVRTAYYQQPRGFSKPPADPMRLAKVVSVYSLRMLNDETCVDKLGRLIYDWESTSRDV